MLPWITIFGSLVMRFANDIHSWLRHSWKSLANRLTRDPKIVRHGNSCIILYVIVFWKSFHYLIQPIICQFCIQAGPGPVFCLFFIDHFIPKIINTFRPKHNHHHSADSIFKCIFWLQFRLIVLIEISLKYVLNGRIDDDSIFFQVMMALPESSRSLMPYWVVSQIEILPLIDDLFILN